MGLVRAAYGWLLGGTREGWVAGVVWVGVAWGWVGVAGGGVGGGLVVGGGLGWVGVGWEGVGGRGLEGRGLEVWCHGTSIRDRRVVCDGLVALDTWLWS